MDHHDDEKDPPVSEVSTSISDSTRSSSMNVDDGGDDNQKEDLKHVDNLPDDGAPPPGRSRRHGGGRDPRHSNFATSWATKEISLQDIPGKISNGNSVYIGSTAATTEASLKAITDDWNLADIQIIQMVPGGNLPHFSESHDRFRTCSFYSFTRTGGYYTQTENGDTTEGLEDYTPMSLTAIPRLLEEKRLSVDVAIIKVTPPQKGFVSLGMGVEFTKTFIRHAKTVIAEVNPQMPWTEGRSKISIADIDWWVHVDQPMLTTEQLWPGLFKRGDYPFRVLNKIGKNVLKEIPDGATLRFGVHPVSRAVMPFLNERKDLGLHTDFYTDTLMELQEEGVINNKYKTIDTGRTVVSQAHGSCDLYDYLDRNPAIEFHSLDYTCDPRTLAKIDNLISIVGALKVDLSGQVATDSISHKFYGGIWSDDDSVRGARFSKGGKPIVVIPSQSLHGRSNIVFDLPLGTGISITRSDVEYVVTEYGCAYLYGKPIRERCLALIDIAHPDHRQSLLEDAKAHNYISKSQPGKSFGSVYPAQYESVHTTKTQKKVFVRPIKAVDEDHIRNFFHKLSDHSIYLRYFRRMKSMPQRVLQKTADVDYSKDMAIVVLTPHDSPNYEIVGMGQWVSDPRGEGLPEVAFQVRDDWQGEGLGSYLFKRMTDIAKDMGVKKLKADVLADNKGMNRVFEKSGIPHFHKSDFGVKSYTFDLEEENEDDLGEFIDCVDIME